MCLGGNNSGAHHDAISKENQTRTMYQMIVFMMPCLVISNIHEKTKTNGSKAKRDSMVTREVCSGKSNGSATLSIKSRITKAEVA
ncbi:MAG: hypothetical protein KAS29_09950 [Bacteroidales bacterium]|nr:hypothetical protein [Bacteroidales bacterium]